MELNRLASLLTAISRRVSGKNGVFFPGRGKSPQCTAGGFIRAGFHRSCRHIFLFTLSIFCLALTAFPLYTLGQSNRYVGSEACKGCHEKEHTSFATHSKMSNSFHSIARMKKGLTPEELKKCYECHTTGYGKPGGFVSEAETPGFKNLGCEACHGPGSSHASSGNPKEIKKHLEVKDCETCHARDRVAAFNYKPLLFGGAH